MIPRQWGRDRRPMNQFQQHQFPPTGNVMLVDSLEHALGMPTGYHSDNVYFHSTQDIMYRIYTNEIGEKSYLIFDLTPHVVKPDPQNPSQEDLASISKRVAKLEEILEVKHGKSNVTENADSVGSTTTE